MPVEVRLYGLPLCGACQSWKRFLEAEEIEYTFKPLSALAGDILAAEALRIGLVVSLAERNGADGALHIAPVVCVVHPEIPGKRAERWNLLAEGTPPPLQVKDGELMAG